MCLSLGTVLWGLWYLNTVGFSEKWRQMVISEIEKRGVHLTVQRLTLNPFQGLVARDVQIRTSGERGRPLASINEVVLDLNYSNLVHGEPFLNAVELRNATLSLPIASSAPTSKSGRLEISRLNARVLLPPRQLTLEQAEAVIHGVHITATGRLINPEKLRWPQNDSGSEDRESSLLHLQKALQILDDLKIAKGHPTLNLRFNGDLANPEAFLIQAAFRAGKFNIDASSRIDFIHLDATLSDGLVRLDQCAIKDAQGKLDASGSFCLATGEADLQLRSNLDLPELIRAVSPASTFLNELVFYSPPELDLSGKARFREPSPAGTQGASKASPGPLPGNPRFFGRLSLGRFAVRSTIFEGAETDFSWEGERWYLHDARIRHKDGGVMFNALRVPGDFRLTLDSRLNPKVLLPFLGAEARERLSEWEFLAAPVMHLQGSGTAASLESLDLTGHVQLGSTRARGVGIKEASLDLAFKNNLLSCTNVKLERPEGSASGTVIYDLATDELGLQNVRATLNAAEFVSIFDRDLALNLQPYRFKAPPSLIVNGKAGCRRGDWQRNNLRIDISGSRGMDYTFLKKNLSASKISGTVVVLGERLKLSNLDAALFGGHLRGKADISLRKEKGDYTAEILTEEVDFPSLTKLYFDYDTSKGKLNGSFTFSGLHDITRAIDGKGELTVTEGNVFAIPIFGPFSSILDEILPGTGYNAARKGTCTFEMREGVITTTDLVMEGKGFSIFGDGKLYVVEDRMDFTARINAQGLPGKLLSPVSRIFEYVSDGSLSKPVWRPKRLPKAIFSSRSQPSPTPTPMPLAEKEREKPKN